MPYLRPAPQSGSALVELLGTFPWFLLAVAFVWQVALAGYALLVAASLTPAVARAAALGLDPSVPLRSASAGLEASLVSLSREEDAVQATVRVAVPLTPWPFLERLPGHPAIILRAAYPVDPLDGP